jgi:hypothetical protein
MLASVGDLLLRIAGGGFLPHPDSTRIARTWVVEVDGDV